jgi:two-component system, cell cycle sensor histidine kinase and response regulator CckA
MDDPSKLRSTAEAKLARQQTPPVRPEGPAALVHELQVLQIELEIQNEELRRVQFELEEARDQYVDLYDFAPVGYLTLDRRGVVTRANLAGATLFGIDRKSLVGRPFATRVSPASADRWHLLFATQLREAAERQVCDLALRRGDGSEFEGRLICRFRALEDAGAAVQVAITDVTLEKRAQALALEPERMVGLRAAMDALPIGVTLVELAPDDTPRFITHNSAFDRTSPPIAPTGRSASELSFELFRPDRVTPVPVGEWPGPRAARTGETVRDAELHARMDGTWKVLSVSAAPIPRSDPADPRRAVAVILDITDRVEQAKAVEEVKARLSRVLDGSNDAFFDWDLRTGQVKYSRSFATMLGYDLAELEPNAATWISLIHPDDRKIAREAAGRHERGEEAQYLAEVRLRHKDGRWIWVSSRGMIVERDAEGKPLRMSGTNTDIRVRRRAEDALRESETRFRMLANRTPVGIFQLGPHHEIVFFNPAFEAMTGCTASATSNVELKALIHPADLEAFLRDWRASVEATAPLTSELRIRRRGDQVTWVRLSAAPIQDSEGALVGRVGALVDITEARKAAAYARSLIEASLDPIVIIGLDGKVTDLNPAMEAAIGLPRDRVVGTEVGSHTTDPEKARAGFRQVLAAGTVRDVALRIRHVSGRSTDVLFNATVYRDQDGEVHGVMAVARDVTEVRALQTQLALAGRLAAMGTLVSGVAHEINNPLATVMSGQALTLDAARAMRRRLQERSMQDPEAEIREIEDVIEAMEDARDGGLRIARIVKDLAAIARPDGRRSRVRLVDIAAQAIRWVRPLLEGDAAIELRDEGAPDVAVAVGQVEQVVVNLLTNAARATPKGAKGEIVVRVGPGIPGMARLEVADRGEGIAPEIVDRIFEPFFTTRQVGQDRGPGLGLAVCHAIAEAHGGTLGVETGLGQGSTFRLELPVAQDAAPE